MLLLFTSRHGERHSPDIRRRGARAGGRAARSGGGERPLRHILRAPDEGGPLSSPRPALPLPGPHGLPAHARRAPVRRYCTIVRLMFSSQGAAATLLTPPRDIKGDHTSPAVAA